MKESLSSINFLAPMGELVLVASNAGLRAILWPNDAERPQRVRLGDFSAKPGPKAEAILTATAAQLTEYFAGKRTVFDLPLDPKGTPFQVEVWLGLAEVPYGETTSYARQAANLGRPTATRAVASANGRNPISIVLPCHRIIGSDGSLTGFASGLKWKRWLLDHESGTCQQSLL